MVRKIFVNDISEIDTDNFGVHFSENDYYRHNGGGSNGTTKKGLYEVQMFVDGCVQINMDATSISREEYPHEQEVVLAFDQKIEGRLNVINLESGQYEVFNKKCEFNTGNRADKWVK